MGGAEFSLEMGSTQSIIDRTWEYMPKLHSKATGRMTHAEAASLTV